MATRKPTTNKVIHDDLGWIKNKLNEIYPIKFKLDLVGHKDLYFILDQAKKIFRLIKLKM